MADTVAVVQAEERLNRAHSAAAMASRDHARSIAYARRELGHALRLQEGPPEEQWSTPPHLSQDDIQAIRVVSLQVGIPENGFGTLLQEVELIRQLPDNLAALLIEHWRAKASEAFACCEQGHERQIEQLRARVNELTTAHDCWNHSHPQEPTSD